MGVNTHLFALDVKLSVRGKFSASVSSAMGTKLPAAKESLEDQSVGVTAACARVRAKAHTAIGITNRKKARFVADRESVLRT